MKTKLYKIKILKNMIYGGKILRKDKIVLCEENEMEEMIADGYAEQVKEDFRNVEKLSYEQINKELNSIIYGE